MKGKIAKLYKAVRGGFLWLKALGCIERKDWGLAKIFLEKYSQYSAKKDPQFFLMSAFVDYKLDCPESASKFLSAARTKINESQRYSMGEKNYLQCYADRLASNLLKYSVDDSGESVKYFGDFTTLEYKLVRNELKENFPLPLTSMEGIYEK